MSNLVPTIRAIFGLASFKLIGWAIGLLVLGHGFPSVVSSINAAWVMIAYGILGVLDWYFHVPWLKLTLSIQYSFFWLYALLAFGPNELSFYRTLPETIIICAATVLVIGTGGRLDKLDK